MEKASGIEIHAGLSLSKNPKLAARARKQRFAGLRGKCCGTRVRGSVPQSQSSSLALPCQILVSVDGCQSLAAFGSCIHWMRAPSRRPITPASASCTSTFLTLCSFFFFIFPGEACPTQKTAGTPKRWPRRRWPRWGWTGRTTRTARQRSTPWKRPARRAAPCGSS